ncbi:hypothetical protein E4U21_000287 [Claviceps maximensis]|nr:hypothetical protein E4U21_000287 [Claviceps maximensis]
MAPDEVVWYNTIHFDFEDDFEPLQNYRPGGYHPIMIGDLLHRRYRIINKLGFGGYSTIWLAYDERQNRFVAVKVGTSHESGLQSESRILKELSSLSSTLDTSLITADESDCIPRIQDEFEIQDLHLGNVLIRLPPTTLDHLSIAQFTEKWGEPETKPITRRDGKPLTSNVPREATEWLALDKKSCGDYEVTDAHRLLLTDFGEAFAPQRETRLGKDCHAPLKLRAPEAYFEPYAPLLFPSDIWTLAIAIWEILGIKTMFSDWVSEHELIAQHLDILGSDQFPLAWRELWERTPIDERKTLGEIQIPYKPLEANRSSWSPLEEAFEECVQKYRRKEEKYGIINEEEMHAILNLVRDMMRFRPEDRLTIDEVLQSEWMVKWALPALEQ